MMIMMIRDLVPLVNGFDNSLGPRWNKVKRSQKAKVQVGKRNEDEKQKANKKKQRMGCDDENESGTEDRYTESFRLSRSPQE